jgi:hypothetical protein
LIALDKVVKKNIRHTISVILVSVCIPLQIHAQQPFVDEVSDDSIKIVKVDSLFESLKDTTAWQEEMEFINKLTFEAPNDSSLLLKPELSETVTKDTVSLPKQRLSMYQKDSILVSNINQQSSYWEPNPKTATWLALIVPGGGQIYNRKYWKLPIVYGGFMGCIYALSWNGQMYSDYKRAYIDIMDNDPNTDSYVDMLPPKFDVDSNIDWLKSVLKNRKDRYRRYRDMSIFAFAGVYLVSVIDAYVDAELSHFDISEDLSLQFSPEILDSKSGKSSLGFQVAITF